MRALCIAAALAALPAAAVTGCGSASSNGRPAAQPSAVNPNGPEVSPAGDIPDNQAYIAYSPPGGGYSVKVPEGWARTSRAGATSFTDKLNRIAMQALPASRAPTVASARRTDAAALAASLAGFRLGTVSTVRRTAGRAVRLTYLA